MIQTVLLNCPSDSQGFVLFGKMNILNSMLVVKTINSPKTSWSDFREIHPWLRITLAVVDVHVKVKIREVDSHLVDVAIRVFKNDPAVDSRAEKCLIIKYHLFLKSLMGDWWDRIHGFSVGISIERLSCRNFIVGLFEVVRLFKGTRLLVVGFLSFLFVFWFHHF